MKTTITDNIILRYYLHSLVFSGFGFLNVFNRIKDSCLVTIDYYLEESKEHAEYVNGNLVRIIKEINGYNSHYYSMRSEIDYGSDKITIVSDDFGPMNFIWKTESDGKTSIEVSRNNYLAEILLSDTEMTLIKGDEVSTEITFDKTDLCLYRLDYENGEVIRRSYILFDGDFKLKSMSVQYLQDYRETLILHFHSTTIDEESSVFNISESTLTSGVLMYEKEIRAKYKFGSYSSSHDSQINYNNYNSFKI